MTVRSGLRSWVLPLGAALIALGGAADARAQSAAEAGADFNSARSDALLGTSPVPAAGTGAGSLTSFNVPDVAAAASGQAPAATPKLFAFNGILPGDYYSKDV